MINTVDPHISKPQPFKNLGYLKCLSALFHDKSVKFVLTSVDAIDMLLTVFHLSEIFRQPKSFGSDTFGYAIVRCT